jgi:hypothetical protein
MYVKEIDEVLILIYLMVLCAVAPGFLEKGVIWTLFKDEEPTFLNFDNLPCSLK